MNSDARDRRAQAAWDKIAGDRAGALKPKPLMPPPSAGKANRSQLKL
jgi:hypothetical protein